MCSYVMFYLPLSSVFWHSGVHTVGPVAWKRWWVCFVPCNWFVLGCLAPLREAGGHLPLSIISADTFDQINREHFILRYVCVRQRVLLSSLGCHELEACIRLLSAGITSIRHYDGYKCLIYVCMSMLVNFLSTCHKLVTWKEEPQLRKCLYHSVI